VRDPRELAPAPRGLGGELDALDAVEVADPPGPQRGKRRGILRARRGVPLAAASCDREGEGRHGHGDPSRSSHPHTTLIGRDVPRGDP
jgi:hypothetical protein